MKTFGHVSMLVALAALIALSAGCTGGARETDSCRDCNNNADDTAREYCVEAPTGQLYCANPCGSSANCALDFRCIYMKDAGTPWSLDGHAARMVCMDTDELVVIGGKETIPVAENCQAEVNCKAGYQCLLDTDYDQYYCSEPCTYDDECQSYCCADADGGTSYCSPYSFCAGKK